MNAVLTSPSISKQWFAMFTQLRKYSKVRKPTSEENLAFLHVLFYLGSDVPRSVSVLLGEPVELRGAISNQVEPWGKARFTLIIEYSNQFCAGAARSSLISHSWTRGSCHHTRTTFLQKSVIANFHDLVVNFVCQASICTRAWLSESRSFSHEEWSSEAAVSKIRSQPFTIAFLGTRGSDMKVSPLSDSSIAVPFYKPHLSFWTRCVFSTTSWKRSNELVPESRIHLPPVLNFLVLASQVCTWTHRTLWVQTPSTRLSPFGFSFHFHVFKGTVGFFANFALLVIRFGSLDGPEIRSKSSIGPSDTQTIHSS